MSNPYGQFPTPGFKRTAQPPLQVTKAALRDDEILIRWGILTSGDQHALETHDVEDATLIRISTSMTTDQLRELHAALAKHIAMGEDWASEQE